MPSSAFTLWLPLRPLFHPAAFQIATRVEVFVGAPQNPLDTDPNNCIFKRLGYLSFDSNERSNHQARELKSVHVNVQAFLIRLLIHRCHVNKLNIYNQVGPGVTRCSRRTAAERTDGPNTSRGAPCVFTPAALRTKPDFFRVGRHYRAQPHRRACGAGTGGPARLPAATPQHPHRTALLQRGGGGCGRHQSVSARPRPGQPVFIVAGAGQV